MDKNELERRLEAAEKQNIGLLDEIKNLKAQLAEMQDEPEILDAPMFAAGEKYCCATPDYWLYHGYFKSGKECNSFNYFHTKAYAQEFANKCKLIAMMLHCKWYLDRDYVPKWNDERNFCVYFSHLFNKFMVYSVCRHEDVTGYFSTEESAQKCAGWLNERWKENESG